MRSRSECDEQIGWQREKPSKDGSKNTQPIWQRVMEIEREREDALRGGNYGDTVGEVLSAEVRCGDFLQGV